MYRPRGIIVAITIPVVVALLTACGSSDGADAEPVAVAVYGDSLLYESAVSVRRGLGSVTKVIDARPGAAVCDLVPVIREQVPRLRPQLVVIETAANGITRCMQSVGTLGSQPFARRYVDDVGAVIKIARSAGARVLVVEPPPFGGLNAASDGDLRRLMVRLRSAYAGHSGVQFIAGPRDAVSDRGRFLLTMPCGASESNLPTCRKGQISIRDPAFGVHFCPRTYRSDAELRKGCRVYSSGARRFGRALAEAIRAELGTQRS